MNLSDWSMFLYQYTCTNIVFEGLSLGPWTASSPGYGSVTVLNTFRCSPTLTKLSHALRFACRLFQCISRKRNADPEKPRVVFSCVSLYSVFLYTRFHPIDGVLVV